jgi:hypothetical protein
MHELEMLHQCGRCGGVVDVRIGDHFHQIVGRVLLVVGQLQIDFGCVVRVRLDEGVGLLMRGAHRHADLWVGVVEGQELGIVHKLSLCLQGGQPSFFRRRDELAAHGGVQRHHADRFRDRSRVCAQCHATGGQCSA